MKVFKSLSSRRRACICALVLLTSIMTAAAAFASWPTYNSDEDPYRGYRLSNSSLPSWFMDYQNSLFRSSGLDYSFLPLYKPGHGSSLPTQVGYIATDAELEDFMNEAEAASGGTMKWGNVFEYYAVNDYANGILRYEEHPLTGERKLIKLPVVVFSKEGVFEPEDVVALHRPVVWLQGEIHGNETSGGDAEQVMIQRLTQGDLKYVLDRIVVVMLPRANPEGAWRMIRGNNAALFTQGMSGQDPNRDNIWFESVLQRAVHKIMNAYAPHVVIDQHEQGAWAQVTEQVRGTDMVSWINKPTSEARRLNDLSILYAPHPVNSETITALGYEFEEDWRELLAARGIRWSVYPAYSRSSNFEGLVLSSDGVTMMAGRRSLPSIILEADGDPRMVDPSYGLKGAASYLSETSTQASRTLYDTRVRGHNTIAESLLLTSYNNADRVYETIMRGRAEQADLGRNIGPSNDIQFSYLYSPTWDDENVPGETITEYYATRTNAGVVEESRPGVKVTRMALARGTSPSDGYVPASVIQRPYAYIISSDQQAAFVDRFTSTGVRLSRLTQDVTLPVTAFRITNRLTGNAVPSSTSLQSTKTAEPWPHIISGECYSREVSFKAGTLVMYMDQPIAPYGALALDPQSCWNYANIWWRRTTRDNRDPVGYLPVGPDGSDFPTYRLMEVRDLPTEELPDFAKYVTGINTITPKLMPFDAGQRFAGSVNGILLEGESALHPIDIQLPTQYTLANRYTFDGDELVKLVRLMGGDIKKTSSLRWLLETNDGGAAEVPLNGNPLSLTVDLARFGIAGAAVPIFTPGSNPSQVTIRLVAAESGGGSPDVPTPDDVPPISVEDLLDESRAVAGAVISQDGRTLTLTIPESSGLLAGDQVKFWFFRRNSDGGLELEAITVKLISSVSGLNQAADTEKQALLADGDFAFTFNLDNVDGSSTALQGGNYVIEFEGYPSGAYGYTALSSTIIEGADPGPSTPGGGSGGCDAGFGAFALIISAGVLVIRGRKF